ncbi:hypothetical protein [Tropicibacter oceani]|uniref:Secreted protein n=1 Tax=Tropicibacter oceani TaxID=3058420 RepID=A0ABY8QGY9_9RHOB|nr:hypothetical protein [Tropicibacter oceani]WGW03911.1 hypothetical protein QF118_18650 [Tropicibacter oceani]
MRTLTALLGAGTALALTATASITLANSDRADSEQGQRDILLACQDRLFGVPPTGAETYMETTDRNGYPMVRVIQGGIVSAAAARDINACAARHLGFGGPQGSGYVTRSNGGINSMSAGCYPGAPKIIGGTSYCFN